METNPYIAIYERLLAEIKPILDTMRNDLEDLKQKVEENEEKQYSSLSLLLEAAEVIYNNNDLFVSLRDQTTKNDNIPIL